MLNLDVYVSYTEKTLWFPYNLVLFSLILLNAPSQMERKNG